MKSSRVMRSRSGLGDSGEEMRVVRKRFKVSSTDVGRMSDRSMSGFDISCCWIGIDEKGFQLHCWKCFRFHWCRIFSMSS